MFELDYYINTKEKVSIFSEEDLRYRFLLGGVRFKTNTVKIDMQWDWIPLLDFAYSMRVIVGDLKKMEVSKCTFEFTESSELLKFYKDGIFLKIIPSFDNDAIEILFEQFDSAISKFYSQILMQAEKEMDYRGISLDLLKTFLMIS